LGAQCVYDAWPIQSSKLSTAGFSPVRLLAGQYELPGA